mmetsp:Transcript_80406/g.132957  ORF Transcript_80406/g.132957 Transcript_80406/m.132957 type:complete len:84 (-) Transcript_80406:189-440(-)
MSKPHSYAGLPHLPKSLLGPHAAYLSSADICFLRRPIVVFAVAAAVVVTCQQPPATVFPQVLDLHFQMPPAVRFTESFPQKVQ